MLTSSRRRRFVWWPVLALAGLLAGLGLAALAAAPRIVGVTPEPGRAGVSSEAPIEIAFSTAMQADSVEARFRVDPDVAGRFEWLDGGRVMRFRPEAAWPEGGPVRAALDSGARSARGLPLWAGREWEFAVGSPAIAFIADRDGVPNLYRVSIAGAADPPAPTAVTATRFGVYDSAVSPDGTRLVFSALRDDGGADLRVIGADGTGEAALLDCPGEACVAPALSPDGRWLAFERRPLTPGPGGAATFGNPRVWLLDLNGGAPRPVGEDGHITGAPAFPRDNALAFFDADLQAVVLTDLVTQAATFIPNTSGDPGSWSPDGRVLVFPEITFPPEPTPEPTAEGEEDSETFYSHLLSVTAATNATRDLSGETFVEDASPAFSPSGERIAFARRYLDNDRFTPGRQLWIMAADGSGARRLTDEPRMNHSAIAWSPDGSRLAFMKFDVTDLATPAAIWLINADGSGARLLAPNAYLPRWVP